jgi:hypothetical protein
MKERGVDRCGRLSRLEGSENGSKHQQLCRSDHPLPRLEGWVQTPSLPLYEDLRRDRERQIVRLGPRETVEHG